MFYTILILIGSILSSILIICLVRFILIFQKVIQNISSNINDITNEIKGLRTDVSAALGRVDKLLDNAVDTIDETNRVITQMKNVMDTISAPITGIQKYSSAVGKFMVAFKGRLNKKNNFKSQ